MEWLKLSVHNRHELYLMILHFDCVTPCKFKGALFVDVCGKVL